MTTFSLNATLTTNTNAYVIDDNYFSTVARANDADNTIDLTPADNVTTPSEGDNIDALQEARFQSAISSLGVTSIRWPGGTEAERGIGTGGGNSGVVFDWQTNDPNSAALDVADLQAVIRFCAENNLNLSFTFPTETFQTMYEDPEAVGEDIDTYMAQFEGGIQTFIQTHLLQYAFDLGVTVDSIKIGNEYNLNNLTASEYGVIANNLAQFIGEAVDDFETANNSATRPDITIESGPIWAEEFGNTGTFYGSEEVSPDDYDQFADIIIGELDADARAYITAVDIHDLTLRIQSYDDYFGYTYVEEYVTHVRSPLNEIYGSLNTSETPEQTTSNVWTDAFDHDVELHSLAWSTEGKEALPYRVPLWPSCNFMKCPWPE